MHILTDPPKPQTCADCKTRVAVYIDRGQPVCPVCSLKRRAARRGRP